MKRGRFLVDPVFFLRTQQSATHRSGGTACCDSKVVPTTVIAKQQLPHQAALIGAGFPILSRLVKI